MMFRAMYSLLSASALTEENSIEGVAVVSQTAGLPEFDTKSSFPRFLTTRFQ
jgi:hypothetical protein